MQQRSRRNALQLLGLSGLSALLGACASHATKPTLGTVGDPLPRSDDRASNDVWHPSHADDLERWRARRNERPHNVIRQPSHGIEILARGRWAQEGPIRSLAVPMNGISRITVHHEGSSAFTSTAMDSVVRRLESIRNDHRRRGWADIGYHYVIDPAGRIYEARPTALQGAHVRYNNEHNLGVMVLGNFEVQSPTSRALASLQRFLSEQMSVYRVPVSRVYTHRELRPTLCPGANLQRPMLALRDGVLGRLARV